jgi:hypothetical protein
MGDEPRLKAATYTGQHKRRINENIQVLRGLRTYNPSVRVGEDISCLRPRGHCDLLSVSMDLLKILALLPCQKLCVYFLGLMAKSYEIVNLVSDIFHSLGVYFDIHKT